MKRKYLMLCIAMAVSGAAGAQTETVVEVDLGQAIAIALDENPVIRIAGMEIEKYDYVLKETKGNLLPNLSANGGYTRNIISQKMGGSIKVSGDNNFTAGANMTLPLFAPGIYSLIKMNREQMVAAVESARGSRIVLVNDVKKGFYNVLLAEQSLAVLKASEATVSETVENTRTMYANGLVAEYDLLTAEVQLSNLKPTILQTEMAVKLSKMMLKMYMGLGDEIDIVLKGSLNDFRDEVIDSGTIFSSDLSGNSELKLLDAQREILDQSLKLQRTQRMPTVGAVANITFTGTDLAPMDFSSFMGGEPAPRNYKYNWQRPAYVGAQVSIPIFAGNSRVNKERQIRTEMGQLELRRSYAEEGKKVELNNAVNNILTARESMFANEKTVNSAQKAYEIANTRYSAGAGTMLELNSAELNMTRSKLNYTQSICDFLSAQADYERIVGIENDIKK